jgi:DNA gyrase/topoisomerase IV subunit A
MINKEDLAEWLAQITIAPESAPVIVRTLTSRLKNLSETNEELRNENIRLQESLNQRSHESEVDELQRQIRALSRMMSQNRKREFNTFLILWSESGKILPIKWDDSLFGERIHIPILPSANDKAIQIITVLDSEELLYITNKGQFGTINAKDLELLNVSSGGINWHTLPGLNLSGSEFVSVFLPIALLPVCEAFVSSSYKGFTQSIPKWNFTRLMQSSSMGRGAKYENDVRSIAKLAYTKTADIILLTRKGCYSRFPVSEVGVNVSQAIKLDTNDYVVGLISDDESPDQLVIISEKAKGIRRSIHALKQLSFGTKGKQLADADDILGGIPVHENSKILVLYGENKNELISFYAKDIPIEDRSRSLTNLPISGINKIYAFAAYENI